MTSAKAAAARLRATLDRATERSPRLLVRIVTRTAQETSAIEPFDRAMTLAAQAFTSLFPVIIVVASVGPNRSDSLGTRLGDALSLPDTARSVLEQALPTQTQSAASFGLIGLLIVVLSATSFSRALARMYARAWHVQPVGWSSGWRWISVLLAVSLSGLALHAAEGALAGDPKGYIAALFVTLVANALLWTWVPWLLLARVVSFIALIPGGLLMGLGTAAASFASRLYLPRALESASGYFGALGIALTYIGWLFIVSFMLILTTVLGAVLARGDGSVAASGAVTTWSGLTRLFGDSSDADASPAEITAPPGLGPARPGPVSERSRRVSKLPGSRTAYEIQVSGQLPAELARDIAVVTSNETSAETMLLTPTIDQASLYDIVARLGDLGIELVEIRRTANPKDPTLR